VSRLVLLVEPDVDALGALASKLRARGLTVDLADNIGRALERARAKKPEVILVSSSLVAATDIVQRLQHDKDLQEVPRFILVDVDELSQLPPAHLPRNNAEAIVRRLYALPSRSAAAVAEREDFRGDLQQLSVVDLLQLLSMNRRTGVLSITTPLGAGEVRLASGEIVDAVYRRLEGEKALYRLLAETEGAFAFVSGSASSLRRVEVATHVLLLEGMRQIDEIRRWRSAISSDDAMLAVLAAPEDASKVEQRVCEVLTTPHTVDELLDEIAVPDVEVLEALGGLLQSGRVRKILKGAMRAELADPEQLTVLAAVLKRLGREGFSGAARVVVAGSSRQLATLRHCLGRIADAVQPTGSLPSVPVPHLLGTLRLGEGSELDVVGLPTHDNFGPLWGLSLPGSAVVVALESPCPRVLEDAAQVAGVRLLGCAELIGELDEADPVQVAALIRVAIDAASGS
jgi:CheY-like chemotaxis protein